MPRRNHALASARTTVTWWSIMISAAPSIVALDCSQEVRCNLHTRQLPPLPLRHATCCRRLVVIAEAVIVIVPLAIGTIDFDLALQGTASGGVTSDAPGDNPLTRLFVLAPSAHLRRQSARHELSLNSSVEFTGRFAETRDDYVLW